MKEISLLEESLSARLCFPWQSPSLCSALNFCHKFLHNVLLSCGFSFQELWGRMHKQWVQTAPTVTQILPWGSCNAVKIIRVVSGINVAIYVSKGFRKCWLHMQALQNVLFWSKFRSVQSEANFLNLCLRGCHVGSYCIMWCIISHKRGR